MTLKPFRTDGGDISTGRLKEIADTPYGDEEKCWLAKRLLALLDEVKAKDKRLAELERSETQLIDERDNAESAMNDAYTAVMGQKPEWSNWFSFADAIDEIALVCGLWRNQTEDVIQFRARVAELEAREVELPERYEVDICPTPSPDGEWYSREDILAALVSAGVSYAAGTAKGE
ncbi:hypothetical protein ACOY5P_03495 [Enterobacter asburiae]|uniref:hypothetical protein n=1 Tax=Enterobacter asburiae TaxID=61645 RepID=UPI003BD9741C